MPLARTVVRALWLGIVVGAAGGGVCNPVSIFACDTDEACIAEGGEGGQCEANNYCSFPDMGCPGTLRRWHDRASSDIAGKCVEGEIGNDTEGVDTEGEDTEGDDDDDAEDTSGGADDTMGVGSTGVTTMPDDTTGSADSTPMTDDGSTGSMMDTGAMTCDEQFGAALDYMLCDEQPDSCQFNVTMNMMASCNDVCAMYGGMCTAADTNDADLCVSSGMSTCDDMASNNAICTCSKM